MTYWGETPLTFAACLDLDHVFRSLWAKGADINTQDTNGNTVLHMMVLHDKKVFDHALDYIIQPKGLGVNLSRSLKTSFQPVSLNVKKKSATVTNAIVTNIVQ